MMCNVKNNNMNKMKNNIMKWNNEIMKMIINNNEIWK